MSQRFEKRMLRSSVHKYNLTPCILKDHKLCMMYMYLSKDFLLLVILNYLIFPSFRSIQIVDVNKRWNSQTFKFTRNGTRTKLEHRNLIKLILKLINYN